MAFLRAAVGRPHHAYVFAGPEGSRQVPRRPRVRRGAALPRRRVWNVPRLPPRARRPASERVPRRARGPRHPRRHGPRGDLAAGVPHGAGAGTQGVRDPRGRPAVARRRRHAAEGARGAAAPIPCSCCLGSCPRASRDRLSRCHVVTFAALPEAFVVDQLRSDGVDEVRARLAARLAGGNLGRARRLATATDGLGVPRRGGSRPGPGRRGSRRRARGRRASCSTAAAIQEGTQGGARRRARPVPRRERSARGRLSRVDPQDRDPRSNDVSGAPNATTSTGCCSGVRPSSATGSSRRSVVTPRCC